MLLAVLSALAGLAGPVEQVEVTLDRDRVSVVRGEVFTVESRITNRGSGPTMPLKAHLNVASLTGTVSVDPSDWTPDNIQDLAPLAPGASASLSWEVKAGDIGTFALYVVFLPAEPGGSVVASATAFVEASGRDPLDAGETLPFVVAIPVLLGSAAGVARWRFRVR